MTGGTDRSTRAPHDYASIALVIVYLVVLVRTAWLSDDAYITFRYAYNVVHGYGLTWNPGFRVQAFTNPLWTFVLAIAYFVTREIYFTSLALSMLFSVGTLAVIWRLATSQKRFLIGATTLVLSKSFVDYSTSGLEDPLLHFLLAVFAFVFLTVERPRRRLGYLSLVGALVMTTRMDTVLLVTPAVLVALGDVLDTDRLRATSVEAVGTMAVGGLPFLAWKAFAMVYYGFPVPNTYYAKTNTTDTRFELVQQGYHYLVGSFAHDPVLLIGLVAGFALAYLRGDRRLRALAAGAGLYLVYVVAIGGDFMAGRLLSEPLVLAVVAIVRTVDLSAEQAKMGLLLVIAVSVGLPTAPPFLQTIQSGADYGGATVGEHGIVDERGFYYQGTGLLATRDQNNRHHWAVQGRNWANSSRRVRVSGVIGMRGYYAGPDVHVIDYNALSDPLLAHIEGDGRVGHYARPIPAGYERTVRTGENHLKSEGLHRFYDKVHLIVAGDLWSAERLVTIVRMNRGAYDHLVEPPMRWTYPLHRMNAPVPNGTDWNAPEAVVFDSHIDVTVERPAHSTALELSADRNDRYRLEFVNNGTTVGTAVIHPSERAGRGLVTRTVRVPRSASRAGFTRIRIVAFEGDDMYSVGHVRLLNRSATAPRGALGVAQM